MSGIGWNDTNMNPETSYDAVAIVLPAGMRGGVYIRLGIERWPDRPQWSAEVYLCGRKVGPALGIHKSGHVGRGYTSREEAKAVAELALRGWLLAMVEQVGGVEP